MHPSPYLQGSFPSLVFMAANASFEPGRRRRMHNQRRWRTIDRLCAGFPRRRRCSDPSSTITVHWKRLNETKRQFDAQNAITGRRSPLPATATNTLHDAVAVIVCASAMTEYNSSPISAHPPSNCPFSPSAKVLHMPRPRSRILYLWWRRDRTRHASDVWLARSPSANFRLTMKMTGRQLFHRGNAPRK